MPKYDICLFVCLSGVSLTYGDLFENIIVDALYNVFT